MKLLKLAGLSVCAGLAALSADFAGSRLSNEAVAQQLTLDQVLSAVRQERRQSAEDNREREAEFLRERNSQRAKLAQVQQQKEAAKNETLRLEGVRDANKERIAELESQLNELNSEYRDLFGSVNAAADDLARLLDGSLISAQFPGRSSALLETARSEKLPAIEELEYLWLTHMQEIQEQGKVATFSADVIKADGQPENKSVTRVGPFVAFSGGEFFVYESDDDGKVALRGLKKQPSGFTGLANNVAGAGSGDVVRGIIDPSLGSLLKLSVQTPDLRTYIEQGGLVGNVIIGLTIFGILLGIYKLVTLTLTNGAVRSQARSKRANKGNPLGRVMMAYESTNTNDVETVALKLDDAVLKEIPRLEGGLNLIKVLAAVAPLLGLLGTVVGMIQTFQAITLFGTGDPQIMADGISSALVTTVMGLISAIPLLFLHAFASGASKSVSQVLEEKAAGIIAEHAESRG